MSKTLDKLLKELESDIEDIKKNSPEKAKKKRNENENDSFILNGIKIVKK